MRARLLAEVLIMFSRALGIVATTVPLLKEKNCIYNVLQAKHERWTLKQPCSRKFAPGLNSRPVRATLFVRNHSTWSRTTRIALECSRVFFFFTYIASGFPQQGLSYTQQDRTRVANVAESQSAPEEHDRCPTFFFNWGDATAL